MTVEIFNDPADFEEPEQEAPSVVIVAIPAISDPIRTKTPEQDLHVSLCYLGDLNEGIEFLMQTLAGDVNQVADAFAPFLADVSGRGRLGDNDAAVVFLESEELADLHTAIENQPCISQIIAMSTEQYPTWIPHLTLGYGPDYPIEDMTAGELDEPIEFDSIGIWAGDTKMIFALTGGENVPENVLELFGWDSDDVDSVTMVDMSKSPGLYAAGAKGFDESLHPRGADGQFIAKFGIIKWLKDGHWKYGRVDGINKDPKGNGIQITATPSDLGGKPNGQPAEILKPNQVYKAPVKVAHLPVSAPGVKKVGGQAGSNEGGLYTIPDAKAEQSPLQQMLQQGLNPQALSDIAKGGQVTAQPPGQGGKKFYVKKAKTPDHGRNEELANTLYADAGVLVPAVDYSQADGNIYSPIIDGKHDMTQRLNDKEWLDKVRANFAVDAWLSNRDVFGLTNDNILTDENGTPVRIDNGGALLFRAMGAKKTDFGSTVTELDVFRTGKKAKVFGEGMTKDQELDGAQRVLAISPQQIDDRVAEAGLPKSLADTLKARRAYIASYYGLPLPESIKPADTDQVATTAPLLDPADVSKGKGKSRNWFPMSLTTAAFVASTGDKMELPDGQQVGIGVDADGHLMSTVAQQSAYLALTQQYGADAKVMVHKSPSGMPRPEHGQTLASNQLANMQWQRGDSLIDDSSGDEFTVLGANKTNGGMLIQAVAPEGVDPAPPFLYDSWATQPNHTTFTVKRWDPPAVIETTLDPEDNIVPAEPIVPSVPEGQAEAAKELIKEDLVVPLPKGNGAPPAPKTAVAPGDKKMILGDGTEASAGDTVVSKFGGEYKFVKPKGPYAVVTDPNSDTPDKLLTKKANTLLQPGKEKAAVPGAVDKPTTADGTVPQVGMMAKAKDGHEGEITMVSPDGKFVFITDANGKKKRKSVGTVTITEQSEAPVPLITMGMAQSEHPTDPNAPDIELSTEEQAANDAAKEANKALMMTMLGQPPATPPAEPQPQSMEALFNSLLNPNVPEEGEFKPIDEMELKPGDKVSTNGSEWKTIVGVDYGSITTTDADGTAGKIPSNDLNVYTVQVAAVGTPPPVPSASDLELDLPGGYVPNEGETILKLTPKPPNQPEYYVGTGDGDWSLLTSEGPDLAYPLQDADIFSNPDGMPVEVVHGETPEAMSTSTATQIDLSDPNNFAYLSAGDQLTLGNKSYTLVGMPLMQGNNGVVAAYDSETGGLVPLYQSAFKDGQDIQVLTNPSYGGLASLPGGDQLDANPIYDNAWKSPDLDTLQGAHGNASVSFLALQQGLDPNTDKWLAFDPTDESFWDLSDQSGTGAALKWNPDDHTWNPDPAQPVQSMQPVIKNELPPDPDAPEPVGQAVYNYTNPTGGVTTFVKTGPDTWVAQDQLDLGNDPAVVGWTEDEMAIHFDFAPDKVVETPASAPPPGGSVVYGNYQPEPGDKIISLTSGFNGGTVETFWVQKPGQTDWYGVLSGEDGKLNTAHPLPDGDMQLMQDLDNWQKTELYGFESSPDTPQADNVDLPGNYAADDDETVVHTVDGNWYTSSDGGQNWNKINSDGTLGSETFTKEAFEGGYPPEDYTVVHEATAPQGVPTPEDPAAINPPNPAPAPTVLKPPPAMHPDLEALPGGYTPVNGKKIRKTAWGNSNPTYWEAVTDKGAFWRQIMPDGTVGTKKVGTNKLPGWGSVEIFDGNLNGLQDMKSGNVGPSGLPLSVIQHKPVPMAELPEKIQDFLLANPGTGVSKLDARNTDKKPGYFMTMPDGNVKGYSFIDDQITDPNGSPTNQTLLKSWNLKKDQPGDWTFTDVTPNPQTGTAPTTPDVPEDIPAAVPEPVAPQPVDISPADIPDLTAKIPGTTDHPATPGGYQLQPGQDIKKVQTSVGTSWFVEVQPGIWHKVKSDGSGLDSTIDFDETDWQTMQSMNNAAVETFKVPGEVPTVFDGYTAQPGDTVAKNSPKGGLPNYWVKPEGSDTWHFVNPNGSLSTGMTTNDEAIEWGMNTPEMGTEVVFGAFAPSKPTVTTPAVTTPSAAGATKIKFADLSTENGPLLNGEETWQALGEIPEGHTPWTYDSGTYNYLVSNTGEAFYITPNGTLSTTVLPGGSKQVKIGAPTTPPVTPAGPVITGWKEQGLPDPAAMAKVPTDATFTVPEDGAWAYVPGSNNSPGIYMQLKPGTYDLDNFDEAKVVGATLISADGQVGSPSPYSGSLTLGANDKFYLDPKLLGQAGAPPVTAPVSTPSAPEPAPSAAPKWPGEKLPTQADIDSWGGPLTKDGHIPTVGMFVKRGAMTGKILSINKEGNKATVLTSDGKKSQRQIDLLQVDSSANYQAYAPKAVPVDIPEGVALAVDPPAEALKKTLQDGKWRPILSNTAGVKGGSIVLSSTKTPSGKKVARMQLTLTNEQRASLLAKLQVGGPATQQAQPKGDWVSSSKMSDAVAIGDNIPMRKSSQPNPDGTDRWKVDSSVTPPTHTVTGVADGPGGVKIVTMKHTQTGAVITSNFHPGKSLAVYTWDPNKVKPLPPQPAGSWKLGAIAQGQGWTKADASDKMLAKIEGGVTDGMLSVEPGKPVTGGNAAIGFAPGGGVRKISTNGVVIEIIGLDNNSPNSANGVTVVTIPDGLDETAIGQALQDLDIPYEPMNQESAKHAVRGMIRNLVAIDLKDPDGVKGWSDAKLFTEAGKSMSISDLGWQDVLVGTEESSGKLTYYWSKRAQDAMAAKTKFSVVVRGGSKADGPALASQLMYGHADGIKKRTTGMQGGSGVSASADTLNNAAHGSYASALGKDYANKGLPKTNPLFGKGQGFMAFSHPMAIMGRIQDWRTGPDSATASKGGSYTTDVYGKGPSVNSGGTGATKSSIEQALNQSNSPDFWLGHGFGPETIGFISTDKESSRQEAIKLLHAQGIFQINGRNVEDILITKAQAAKLTPKDIPLPAMPTNVRPILDLPAGPVAAAGWAA